MSWLKKYYGKDFDSLKPTSILEGKKFAVVRLTRQSSRGFPSTGFVLVNKNGNHSASPTDSLHEGMPSREDMDRMKEALAKKEQE
jgi:hypothetical protein